MGITQLFIGKSGMGKCIVVFITLATISVFIAGCTPAKPLPAEHLAGHPPGPLKIEPANVEPASPEPNQIEPNEVQPVESEPNDVKSSRVEPNQPKPGDLKPTETEPNAPAPVKVEPNDVQPAKIEPRLVGVKPTKAEPNEVEPNNIKPAGPEPAPEPNQPKLLPAACLAGQPTVSFHDKCADILKNYVDDKGMVNYRALRRKRPELKNLLDEFAHLDLNVYNHWPKEDKIAFWINAYNIQMLKIITDNYPIQGSRLLNPFYGPNSIRHIKGIWSDYKFIVMDEEFTLAKVNQRFFCKEFGEPRVFFAISHASLSSPPLRNEPYYGHKLHQQLEDQIKRFLSNPQFFRIDKENKKVYLSAILHSTWDGKEFVSKFGTDKKFKDQEPETRAVFNFITNYLSKRDVDFLEVENYSVKYIKYNWTLNDGP